MTHQKAADHAAGPTDTPARPFISAVKIAVLVHIADQYEDDAVPLALDAHLRDGIFAMAAEIARLRLQVGEDDLSLLVFAHRSCEDWKHLIPGATPDPDFRRFLYVFHKHHFGKPRNLAIQCTFLAHEAGITVRQAARYSSELSVAGMFDDVSWPKVDRNDYN